MEIIAKTSGGFLIQASNSEVKSILTAVLGGVDMDKVGIGHKIPAIDYATTIIKVKALKSSDYLRDVKNKLSYFNEEFARLQEVVDQVPAESLNHKLYGRN